MTEEKEVTVDISLDVMKEEQYKTNVWKAFLISIPYAASIGGTATLTGTAPNLILSGQLKRYSFCQSWASGICRKLTTLETIIGNLRILARFTQCTM